MTPTSNTLEQRRALVERWQRILQLLDYEVTVEHLSMLELKELTGNDTTMAHVLVNPPRNHATVSFREDDEDRLGDNYAACHEMCHVPLNLLWILVRGLLETYVRDEETRVLLEAQMKNAWEGVTDKFARAFLMVEAEGKPEEKG